MIRTKKIVLLSYLSLHFTCSKRVARVEGCWCLPARLGLAWLVSGGALSPVQAWPWVGGLVHSFVRPLLLSFYLAFHRRCAFLSGGVAFVVLCVCIVVSYPSPTSVRATPPLFHRVSPTPDPAPPASSAAASTPATRRPSPISSCTRCATSSTTYRKASSRAKCSRRETDQRVLL